MAITLINNILVYLISFLGILVGRFIADLTKIEVREGHRILLILKEVLILIMIGIFLYYSRNDILFLITGLILGLLLGYIFRYLYFYLGISMSLSFLMLQDLLIASIIFLIGLPCGSLIHNLNKKELHNYLIKNLIFFLIPSLILFFPVNLGLLVGVMIGGLIYELKWPFS